jgi:5,10-methylenetetrahydromethanopterin reductase
MQNAKLRFKSRPDIPVYIAATGPKMLSLAGELGEGAFALVGVHPKCVEVAVSQVGKGAVASGRTPGDVDLGLYVHCAVSRSGEMALNECRRGAGLLALRNPSYAELAGIAPAQVDAMRQAASAAGSSFGKGFAETVPDDVVRKFSLAGTPGQCRQALEAVAGSGIRRVDIYLQGPGREETVRLFGEEILPALRRA